MKGKAGAAVYYALATVCVMYTIAKGQGPQMEIFSDPAEGPSLDDGLRSLQPRMTLLLREGTHRLRNTSFVRDIPRVTLRGGGSASRVVITCDPGVGLAFFNTDELRIHNVALRGCGFCGPESWSEILPVLHDRFSMTFKIPTALCVGVLVAASTNVSLVQFTVEETRGIGLLGVNLLGSTQLRNVHFQDNVPQAKCPRDITEVFSSFSDQSRLIGGGAYILYEDFKDPQPPSVEHSLSIDNSRFTRNRDCSATALVENLIQYSVELTELGYTVGAGGGLSIMMAQSRFAVSTSITNTWFSNNVARTGGAIHVGVFSGIPFEIPLVVRRCHFERNGRNRIVSGGGGMVINIDLVRPSQLQGEFQVEDRSGSVDIDVEETRFENNMASSGGGVAIISRHSDQHASTHTYTARFHDCSFEANQALGGSAMFVYEDKITGFNPGLQLRISNSRFFRNSIRPNDKVEIGFINDYGALHVRNINVTLSGRNTFDRNLATALGASSSIINMEGMTVFERNKAVNGAGMQLVLESILVLKSGARLVFTANRADLFGGAIFVHKNPENFTFIPDDCFLYFNRPAFGLCSNSSVCLPQNVSVSFKDNNARLGTLVYGSTLTTCPWISTLKQESLDFNPRRTVYDNLRDYQRTMDYPMQQQRRAPQFSTDTARLEVDNNLNISVMPGEQFFVNVIALDDFGHTIPEVVTSSVVLEDGEEELDDNTTSVIGDFGYFEVQPQPKQTLAPVTVYGDENTEVTLRLTAINLESDAFIRVTLTPCSVGFTHVGFECVCDSRLESHDVSCNVNNFVVGSDVWLGPVREGSNVTNDDLTVAGCVLNYCSDGTREVPPGEWQIQCRESFHRAGRLCGACEEGYSLQLGTNACHRCTNWSLFLLLFFILAGLFVEFVMGPLQISVAEGFFTATIFYSNIITLYSVYFNDNEIEGVNFLTAFFSLNFGIPACLYDGLDSLALVALQLTFVLFLFLLAVLHILIHKKRVLKFTDSINQKYSPSKTFATLIIVTYVSMLQSCFGILAFAVVSSFDGKRHILWFLDPTVDYFSGFHIPLCIISAFLFVLLLPPPIVFTFCTRAIYRWPYSNKLKPLYDAMFAPFKNNLRPWLGLQFAFRVVLFFNAYFVPTPHNLFVVVISLILYLHLQTTLQPYKLKWANHFESTLIFNALVYVIVTLYFGNFSVRERARLLTVIFLSLLATGTIIYGFLRYGVELNPKTWERFKNIIQLKRGKGEDKANGVELNSSMKPPAITFMDSGGNAVGDATLQRSARSASVDYLNSLTEHERARLTSELEVSYTEYREPLLDEGDLDVASSYSVVISRNSSAAGSPSRSKSPQKLTVGARTTDLVPPVDSHVSRTTA